MGAILDGRARGHFLYATRGDVAGYVRGNTAYKAFKGADKASRKVLIGKLNHHIIGTAYTKLLKVDIRKGGSIIDLCAADYLNSHILCALVYALKRPASLFKEVLKALA